MREILDETFNRPEHWGGLRVVPNTQKWGQNQVVTVVSKPPYRALYKGKPTLCVPQVQSALLTAKISPNPNDASANYAFRWVLSIGSGGTRSEVKIDMVPTQQVSVAGEDLRADILCEQLSPDPTIAWENPQIGITAGVTFADGNVSSGQATYTQKFTLTAGTSLTFAIPPMATGWRVIGTSTGATSPFVAAVLYISQGLGGAQQSGNLLSNKDDFIPLALATGFRVDNTGLTTVVGMLQWGLDL